MLWGVASCLEPREDKVGGRPTADEGPREAPDVVGHVEAAQEAALELAARQALISAALRFEPHRHTP